MLPRLWMILSTLRMVCTPKMIHGWLAVYILVSGKTTIFVIPVMRYFIARRFAVHAGFDIARDPEDTAFYLQFGHAWR